MSPLFLCKGSKLKIYIINRETLKILLNPLIIPQKRFQVNPSPLLCCRRSGEGSDFLTTGQGVGEGYLIGVF